MSGKLNGPALRTARFRSEGEIDLRDVTNPPADDPAL
jgi:hypothetical protein